MTISAYTGLPGHGKSYGVVENVIAPALTQKRIVFTNIPLNRDECLKQFSMDVTQFQTQDIIDNPDWWTDVFIPGSLIVIDELWRLWPSGLNAKNVREQDKSFLAEHRHLVGENGNSTEIVFVTQDLSQIAAFARTLVESTYRVVKLSKIGANNRFRVDVYFGPVTGPHPPTSKRDREIYGKFKQEIFNLYQSHTKSASGAAGDESRIDNRFNLLGGMSIKVGVLVLVICSILAYLGLSKVFDYFVSPEKEVGPVVTTSTKNHSPQTQPTKPAIVQLKKPQPIFRFLSKAEGIYVIFNNGRFPEIDYRFQVVFSDTQSTFTTVELIGLKYAIEPINKCTVKITGRDFIGIAMCKRDDEQRDWVDGLVTNIPTST